MTRLFLIVFIQLLYVPMLTLRTISMVKNLKVLTSFFGFMEALIYIFGLAIVLSGDQSILEMVVYAVGFAAGLILGIYIEQKLAIGFTSIQVNIEEENPTLVEVLRKEGFGVTVYLGEGKFGKRTNLDILTRRKSEKNLLKIIEKHEPKAFIMSFEPKMFRGGYLTEMMNGRLKR
ncbi:MAG: hypothetical protein CVU92_03820 [Firmicutes bacterium HGW-Firmicutes-17]|nr:MAG: hypothetical protein CVU92_03820 [Firmicutes bacterium HGW-Firmicutes-17]